MENYTEVMNDSVSYISSNDFIRGRDKFLEQRDSYKKYDSKEGANYFSYQCMYCKYLIFLGNYKDVKNILGDQKGDLDKYKGLIKFSNLDLLKSYTSHLLGIAHFHLGEYTNAVDELNKSLQKLESIGEDLLIRKADTYRALGRVYAVIGNYDEAWAYFYKALSILFHKGRNLVLLPLTLHELGVTFCKNDKNENALRCANLCDFFIEKNGYSKSHLIAGYNQNLHGLIKEKELQKSRNKILGINYYLKYGEILDCFNEAQKIIRETTENLDHSRVAEIYNNKSRVYTALESYDESIENNEKALKIYKKAFKSSTPGIWTHHPFISKTHRDIGYTYLFRGFYDNALKHFQEAIIAIVRGFRERNDISKNPNVTQSAIDSSRELLSALDRKADALLGAYKNKKRTKYLDYAADTIKIACDLIETIKKGPYQRRLNFFYKKRARSICEKMLFIFMNKNALKSTNSIFENIESTFNQFEKFRMLPLMDDFREYNIRNLKGIDPDDYIRSKREMSELIISFEEILLNGKGKSIRGIEDKKEDFYNFHIQMEEIENSFEILNKAIENELKKEFLLKKNEDVSLKRIQRDAIDDDSAAIVNYFMGERFCYAFVISKNNVKLIDLCPGSDTKRKKTRLNIITNAEEIKNIFNESPTDFPEQKDKFIQVSHQLYKQLYLPIKKFLMHNGTRENKERVYIIPDKQLAYIPFDVLLSKKTNLSRRFSELPYLIKNHNFSYHYSATLLCLDYILRYKRENSKTLFFSGFAPDLSLQFTQETMDSLVDVFRQNGYIDKDKKIVKIFRNKDANLKNYEKYSMSSNFLHITSHANIPPYQNNPMDSEIYFYNKERLKVSQILYSRLSAKLAVLACCQTGDLSMMINDEIMSFNRAFLIAGTPNVIYSIYNIPDSEIYKDLTVEFYKHLINKKTFAKALRKAKLFTIEERERGFDRANPQVWAGTAIMGDQTHHMDSPKL